MTYSVQLWSVRDEFAADPVDTLARLRAAGFDAVEPFDLIGLVQHRTTLIELGLSVPSAHVPLIGHEDLSTAYAAARELGTGIFIDSGRQAGWDDSGTVLGYAKHLNAQAVKAAAQGVQLGYHNHWWELATSSDGTALEQFARELDPAICLELDIYWAAIGGSDVPKLLERLGARVALLHVKDGTVKPDPPAGSQVPVGSGEVPISGSLAAAPHALRVLEFDEYPGDIFEALETGLRVVRNLDGSR